ncbi:MAG: hypothetical protein K6G61_02275 [Solobacterium sp.]|nr:hypothetical protein [Solobacterium sp.]
MRLDSIVYRMYTDAFVLIESRQIAGFIRPGSTADAVAAYGYVDPELGIRFYCFADADFASERMLEAAADPRSVSYNSVRFNEVRLYFDYTDEQKQLMRDAESRILEKTGYDPEKAAVRRLGWLDPWRTEIHPDHLEIRDSDGCLLHLRTVSHQGDAVRTEDRNSGGTVFLIRGSEGSIQIKREDGHAFPS